MALSKREQQAKDLQTILGKEIGAKNPLFSTDHIAELHSMFSLYADPRQRKVDVRDILMTAKVLGLDGKYDLVYRALQEIGNSSGGDALDFQSFLRELNKKIGHPFNDDGRRSTFDLIDVQKKGTLDIEDLRYLNQQFRYGFSDDQLVEIIHGVGGFGANEITWEKFNRYVLRKIQRRRI